MTYLESRAVTAATRLRYRTSLAEWLTFRDAAGEEREDDEAMDDSLCRWMTAQWVRGEQANRGEVLMAALLHHRPEFNKMGGRTLPRAWRAVRGWRRSTPARSRAPLARQIWAGICWELCRRKQWLMAIYVLLMVCCYMRPAEPPRMLRGDIVERCTAIGRSFSTPTADTLAAKRG